MHFKNRMAKGMTVGTILSLLVIVAFGSAVGFYGYNWAIQNNVIKSPTTTTTTTTTPGNGYVSVDDPLQINLLLPFTGTYGSGDTVAIIESGHIVETLTTSSSGAATSNEAYPSGTSLILKVSGTGLVTEWVPVTVPQMLAASAQTQSVNRITVNDVAIGTPSVQIVYSGNGNNYAGRTFNFSAIGVTSATFTVTIYNTAANSGWIDSFDSVNNQNSYMISSLSTAGSSVSVTGAQQSVGRGGSTYYLNQINSGYSNGAATAGGFSTYTSGGQTIGGVYSYTITVGVGSLTHGNSQSFTLQLYKNADPSLYASQGTFGPDSSTIGSSTTITFAD